MDIAALDKDLQSLVNKRMELSTIDYNNDNYDSMEEQLHDMEDSFLEEYGDFLEDAFHEVHDEYCPDSDVLLPIAYLPKKVKVNADKEYNVDIKEGVYVDVDDFPGKDTKLVLLPNPTRILLQVSPSTIEVVWQAK